MFALESNLESFEYAQKNVNSNNLSSRITLIHQENENHVFQKLINTSLFNGADFCMCNPPFYAAMSDNTHKTINRTGKRPKAKNVRTGCTDELSVAGGECEFVQKIINQSLQLRKQIKVYTTMLGHKTSLAKVLSALSYAGITNIAQTEFCQGQTTRWGVAWSFYGDIFLRTVPVCGHNGIKLKRYKFGVPPLDIGNFDGIFYKLEKILCEIQLKLENVQRLNETMIKARIFAMENTWSKQRRKRRELERQEKIPKLDNQINTEYVYDDNVANGDGPSMAKNVKLNENVEKVPILVIEVCIGNVSDAAHIYFDYLYGSYGRDGVYQIYQFLSNRWK